MKKIIFSPVYLEHPVQTSLFGISLIFLIFIQESILLTAAVLSYVVYYSFIYGNRILAETHFANDESPKKASESTSAIGEAVASPASKSESVETGIELTLEEEKAEAPEARSKRPRKKV